MEAIFGLELSAAAATVSPSSSVFSLPGIEIPFNAPVVVKSQLEGAGGIKEAADTSYFTALNSRLPGSSSLVPTKCVPPSCIFCKLWHELSSRLMFLLKRHLFGRLQMRSACTKSWHTWMATPPIVRVSFLGMGMVLSPCNFDPLRPTRTA